MSMVYFLRNKQNSHVFQRRPLFRLLRTCLFLLVIYVSISLNAGFAEPNVSNEPGLSEGKSVQRLEKKVSPVFEKVSQQLTPEEKQNIHVYESASPAIVHIAVTGRSKDYYWGLFPFEATGSGVIISGDGYILTNSHVVEDADRIKITLLDGNVLIGKLVGTGDEHDVALIKIDPNDNGGPLPSILMGNSELLAVGQKVFALGGPFGLKSSFSSGVISSLHRRVDSSFINNMIQTDAAINPGNSGGALLNTEGKLIGINTAIYSPSGGSAGIGFAIPVNTTKRIVDDLKKYGRVIRPWLGVQVEIEIQPQLSKEFNLPVSRGLIIKRVKKGSPADLAGLRGGSYQEENGDRYITLGGDIITAVDGKPTHNAVQFIDYIESRRAGDKIQLTFIRNKRKQTVNIELTEKERSQ